MEGGTLKRGKNWPRKKPCQVLICESISLWNDMSVQNGSIPLSVLHHCTAVLTFIPSVPSQFFQPQEKAKKGGSLFLKINAYGRVLLTFTLQPLQLPNITNMRVIFLALSNSISNILYLNQSFSASRQSVLMYFLHSPVIHARTSSTSVL